MNNSNPNREMEKNEGAISVQQLYCIPNTEITNVWPDTHNKRCTEKTNHRAERESEREKNAYERKYAAIENRFRNEKRKKKNKELEVTTIKCNNNIFRDALIKMRALQEGTQ